MGTRLGHVGAHLLAALLGLALAGAASAHDGIHEQLEEVTRQIRRAPTDGALYLRRGELHRLHRDWARALADYARAERLAPARDEVAFARGRMLFEAGRFREASAALDAFLAREPGRPDALLARARTRAALGRSSEAADDYTRLIDAAPAPEPDYYVERARALARLGRAGIPDALRGLDEGIARLGPVASLELAAIEIEVPAARYESALARVDRLAAAAPRKESWLLRRGEILERAGRPAEAREAYTAALAAVAAVPAQRRTRAVGELESSLRERLTRLGAPAR